MVGDLAATPVAKRRLRRLVAVLAALLILAVLAVGGVGWVGSQRALDPAPARADHSLADYPSLRARAQSISIPSQTGITLAARFFPGGDGSNGATIVVSHGFGGNQDQMLPYADFLNRAGFNVLTYDMRHRGGSGGGYVTLGALEQQDLHSIVDYLTTRPDVDPNRIGEFGISLGAATSILEAAGDPRVRAVVDDCGFSDIQSVVSSSFKYFIGLPAFPFAPVTVWITEWRLGVTTDQIRPVAVIGRISPRPIFIIHGTADKGVPPDNSARNYGAAGQPKELWWVPGAGHGKARDVAGAAYDQRVDDFFRQALGSAGARPAPVASAILGG